MVLENFWWDSRVQNNRFWQYWECVHCFNGGWTLRVLYSVVFVELSLCFDFYCCCIYLKCTINFKNQLMLFISEKERVSPSSDFFPSCMQWLNLGQAEASSQGLKPGVPCGWQESKHLSLIGTICTLGRWNQEQSWTGSSHALCFTDSFSKLG